MRKEAVYATAVRKKGRRGGLPERDRIYPSLVTRHPSPVTRHSSLVSGLRRATIKNNTIASAAPRVT
ncbi:MAG: hypothetical protein ACREA0_16835, partial [bacterium]